MQQSANFKRAYQQLNPLQKQAVDHIDRGPLLVLAGPGTGKTQILSLRIANILLKTDVKPDNILALTFTDAAAKNMRERLVKIIGKEAYYLQIHTFHSFCRYVMAINPEYFPFINDSQPLDELEQYQLIETLIDKFRPELLRPMNRPYHHVRAIISAISNLKREGFSPLQFEDILRLEAEQLIEFKEETKSKTKIKAAEKKLAKNQELLLLYQEYQQELVARERYDFDDMINYVLDAFKNHPDLLLAVQEQLQHFLVDEYQDTNNAQNQLVNMLASYWPEQGLEADLFAVGDPNQSIYRFQGASVENVLAFTRTYPNSTVITLDTAYRCPQILYDQASQLISHNQLSQVSAAKDFNLALRLTSAKANDDNFPALVLDQSPSFSMECITVAEEVKKLLESGTAPQEIAILYRNHSDAERLIEVFNKWQLPYQLNQGDDVLKMDIIEQIWQVMTVIDQLGRGEELENIYQLMFYAFFNLDELLVLKLGRAAGQIARQERQPLSVYQLYQRGLEVCNQQLIGQEISEADWQTLSDFFAKLNKLAISTQRITLTAWFEQLISQDGFSILNYLKKIPNKINALLALNTFFQKIKDLVGNQHDLSLTEFLTYLATYQEQKLKIKLKNPLVIEDAVQLSTTHGAKGMEWEHVFLMGVVDKKWGNQRPKTEIKLPDSILSNTDLAAKERNEDDRRLFYVALTRAKKQCHLSYPEVVDHDTTTDAKVPSIFLTELDQEKIKQTNVKISSKQNEAYLERLLEPANIREISVSEKDFFASLVKDFSLSVTALNSYLRDPADFVSNNLLRLPRSKADALCFGTAVHSALERFYRFYQQQGQFPAVESLVDDFKQALAKEILSQEDFDKRLSYGQEILPLYYQQVVKSKPEVFDLERNFSGSGRKIMLGDIRLTGKIDRLDWIDQDKGLVRVIDYKTGRVKSINEILVKTKTAEKQLSARELELPETIRGAYQRQLVFYKLLMDLDRFSNPKLTVVEAAFDFVEPKEKGSDKFIRRSLEVTDEAVFDLKQLVKQVMAEIRSLEFLEQLEF